MGVLFPCEPGFLLCADHYITNYLDHYITNYLEDYFDIQDNIFLYTGFLLAFVSCLMALLA